MAKQAFMPKLDLGKQSWINNFSSKLEIYAAKYNLTADEVKDMKASALFLFFWIDYRQKQEDYLKKLTQFKNELLNGVAAGAANSVQPIPPSLEGMPPPVDAGIIRRASAIANAIKAKTTYTIADGNDLGIEGVEIDLNLENSKPELKLAFVAGGRPLVKWKKMGMDAIEIYVDRGKGSFELLAFDTHPNYTDSSPLPAPGTSAVWTYKAIYRHGDSQVGKWSDVVSITVMGS